MFCHHYFRNFPNLQIKYFVPTWDGISLNYDDQNVLVLPLAISKLISENVHSSFVKPDVFNLPFLCLASRSINIQFDNT